MALPVAFSLLNSEFNEFLFAEIGTAENGMALSTVSALTQLGVDPWEEAAQLSKLPRGAAAQRMTQSLSRLASARAASPDIAKTAMELVQRLPAFQSRATAGPPSSGRVARSWPRAVTAALAIAFLALAAAIYAFI
jgi:hypothetical protein